MTYVEINRVAFQPGTDGQVQAAVQRFFEARRPLLGGDLRSLRLVRSTDGGEYALISVWADAAANDRHEDDAVEREVLQQLGPLAAAPPAVLAGSVVQELTSASG